jgi:hypothetical protein
MRKPALNNSRRRVMPGWRRMAACLMAGLVSGSGCSSLTTPISGVPASRLPREFFAETKADLIPLDLSRLALEPTRDYLVDEGDVLGVYVEGILPYSVPGEPPQLPPVNFPDQTSDLQPSMGFPITVLPDGSLRLPDLRPVDVRGLTISQVADKIRKEYLDADVLRDTEGKQVSPIVTLIRKRQVSVVVVRQDLGGTGEQGARGGVFNQRGYIRGADQSASGALIKLDADEADVLHALMASGGLPGVNAKNEVKILRANRADRRKYDEFVAEFFRRQAEELRPCECPPALPEDPSILRIPLRVKPGEIPDFRPEDIALQRGDVVYIESRDAEVFYTGGKLPGGEWAIPRDYDLDVLGAMAIAGAGFGSSGPGGGGQFNIFLALGQIPPSRLFVIRKTPCNGQVIIEVDLGEAINDPRQRPLVQPGDTLVLQYKPEEEILNFTLGTFFTFGIQQLIREIGR